MISHRPKARPVEPAGRRPGSPTSRQSLFERLASASLHAHLFLLVMLGALPGLGLAVYRAFEERQHRVQQVRDMALLLTELVSRDEARVIDGARLLLLAVARVPEVTRQEPGPCSALLATIVRGELEYSSLLATRLDGEVFCSSEPLQATSIGDREYFRQTIETRGFTVSGLLIGRLTGEPRIALSYPVLDEAGNPRGIVTATLDPRRLDEIASEARLPEKSTLLMVDRDGTVMTYYPDPADLVGQTVPDAPVVRTMLTGQEGVVVTTGLDGYSRTYAFAPVGRGPSGPYAYISIGIPTDVVLAEVDRELWGSLAALLIVSALALGVARIFALRLVRRPVQALSSATRRLQAGDLGARVGTLAASRELRQLATSFDTMAATLERHASERSRTLATIEAYTAQLEQSNRELQDFAYVASHDLQEPLRKIQAFGDRLVARHSAALDEQGRDFLARMHNAAGRMQVMIEDLLAFSRVTTRAQPSVPVELGVVAREVISDLEIRLEETGGRVELGQLPTIIADPLQMRQLLQNLIGNAVKFHGAEPPLVSVSAAYPSLEQVQLVVQDNGIGFDEKYLDRIFTPFQRLHGRGEYPGTGIGLAICRKIVERHDGSITARSAPGRGATFVVTLPRRRAERGEPDADLASTDHDPDGRR